MPDLITTTAQDYERLAIDLATNPEQLKALKRRLAENRHSTPLFDTASFTRHIEKAYTTMHRRHLDGPARDDIAVLG